MNSYRMKLDDRGFGKSTRLSTGVKEMEGPGVSPLSPFSQAFEQDHIEDDKHRLIGHLTH